MQLSLNHDDNKIYFINKQHGFFGYTTFEKDFWDKISQVNWVVDTNKFINKEKTYIKTSNNAFSQHASLHQTVMAHWYGLENFLETKNKGFIVEHHNNNAFDCTIENLSFAHFHLNLAKAHTFDKTQPKLEFQVGVNFFKHFETKQYQISMIFTEDYVLISNDKATLLDSLYLVYVDNFRVVYTDANRIVDELLENQQIDFKLLSYKKMSYKVATFYESKNSEKITGLNFFQDESGNTIMVVGNDTKGKIFFNSTPPLEDLYKK